MLKVLNRSMDPRVNQHANGTITTESNNNLVTIDPSSAPIALVSQIPGAVPGLATPPNGVLFPQQLITCGTTQNCLRMRGLPFEASITDILTFLGDFAQHIALQGVHMVYNSQVRT